MNKNSQKSTSKKTSKSLTSKFEKFLEQEENFDALQLQRNPDFQIETHHQFLENINFSSSQKNLEIFFTRLIPYFEIGFLVEAQVITEMFFYGQIVHKKIPQLKFKLPESPYFNLLKTNATQFMKKMGFKNLPEVSKMVCLLVRVDKNSYIILATQQAEPWLQLRCESLKKALANQDFNSI